MADNFKAGLDENEDLGLPPSAANPLTAMGLDPDTAAANPDILSKISAGNYSPFSDSEPSKSVVAAGKLGGVADPASAPPAPAAPITPASTEPTTNEGYGKAGLSNLYKHANSAAQATDDIPTTEPADLAKLRDQRSKLATPAPRFDPSTGKNLQQTQEYDPTTGKMVSLNPSASTGQKVWRGVRGGLVGLLTGGLPGAAIGAIEPQDIAGGKAYNAPSKAYEQAETRREQQLGATDKDIDTSLKTWKDVNDARKAKAAQYKDVASLDKDLTTGATGLINATTKQETDADKAAAKLQLNKQEYEQRRQQLMTDPSLAKLPMSEKVRYLANGKISDPAQPREPNETDLTRKEIARGIKILGHPPKDLEELNQVISAAKGQLGKGKQADAADATNLRTAARLAGQRVKELETLLAKPSISYGSAEVKKTLQDQLDEAKEHFADLQDQLDPTVKGGPAQPAVAPVAPPSNAKPSTPPPGATHIVPGNDKKNHYTNAQGTVDYGVAP